ncbi:MULTISPECIES: hypothetical protein [unclassified Sphingomonas]|uniref:hypothetical protein n=1 Tax=unclassified Sphingomonas TaxID=196159 RepID=UPI0006FF165B|nr:MULTISPECIES: hypothetical protein [unclassified Sphingomonas]KQS46939.1 hypothetical protein ASG20_16960 [Sphingomonas sp. Leaf198]RMB52310.1 hypothetical protein C8J44_3339 [Sphingomonas sp. PP-CE-3A-406]
MIELVKSLTSLAMILDEENDRLTRPANASDLPELVAAKIRLAGIVEAESIRLARERPRWLDDLPEEEQDEIRSLLETLVRRLGVNANLLERRIAMCDEIMGAIAAEARRLTGAKSAVYGVRGTLLSSEQATPISINGHF